MILSCNYMIGLSLRQTCDSNIIIYWWIYDYICIFNSLVALSFLEARLLICWYQRECALLVR